MGPNPSAFGYLDSLHPNDLKQLILKLRQCFHDLSKRIERVAETVDAVREKAPGPVWLGTFGFRAGGFGCKI